MKCTIVGIPRILRVKMEIEDIRKFDPLLFTMHRIYYAFGTKTKRK